MAALEQIIQMRQQGQSERQIIDSLKEQGVTPKDINDALSQSKIKSEINNEQAQYTSQINPIDNYAQSNPSQELGLPQQTTNVNPQNPTMLQQSDINPDQTPILPQTQNNSQEFAPETMQQSIMSQEQIQGQPQDNTLPSNYSPNITSNQQSGQSNSFMPSTDLQPTDQYYDENNQYPQYEYEQQLDVESITEIAEQLIDEKLEKIKKQTILLGRNKEEFTLKIDALNKRIEKLEDSSNKLQLAILGKIGDYSQDLQNISQSLNATQDAFSKVLNPIMDHHKKKSEKKEIHHKEHKTKKSSKKDK